MVKAADELIKLGDIHPEVIDAIVQTLAPYGVAFIRVENTGLGQKVDLLGSGTLVAVGNKRAILTGHHVVQVLPRTGRLGVGVIPASVLEGDCDKCRDLS